HGSCLPDLVRRAAIVTAMGLDVYVGSLTRYYAQDWETIVQQWGREQGLPVEVRRSQPSPPDRITDPAVIRPALIKWRSNLNQALSSRLGGGARLGRSAGRTVFHGQARVGRIWRSCAAGRP